MMWFPAQCVLYPESMHIWELTGTFKLLIFFNIIRYILLPGPSSNLLVLLWSSLYDLFFSIHNMARLLTCTFKTWVPGVITAQLSVVSARGVSTCSRFFLMLPPILHCPRRRLRWEFSLRGATICLFANEGSFSREATLIGRLVFVSRLLAVAAARIIMALMVSSAFCSRAFPEGYTIPANNGCFSCQIWCSSMKKG